MSIHVRETGKGRRYDVKLRDRDGVMHTKTFRTKREAVDYEADQRAQLSAGTFIAPRASATTVEDLAARWLAAGTKRDSSRARDRSIVQTHLLPGLGPKRAIGTVTRADCQALVDRWVTAGLAPRTVIRVAAALRSMFQYALDAELLARNPAARLKLPQAQPVDRPTLTSDDLDRLAHALGPEQALFMWCGAILGLRWAEVAGLTAGSLDPVRNTITVRHQLDRHGNLVLPKTLASRRNLASPSWLVADLAALPRQRGAAITDQAALVFVTPTGAGLSYVNWRTRVWQPATTTAGLTGLHFHDSAPSPPPPSPPPPPASSPPAPSSPSVPPDRRFIINERVAQRQVPGCETVQVRSVASLCKPGRLGQNNSKLSVARDAEAERLRNAYPGRSEAVRFDSAP